MTRNMDLRATDIIATLIFNLVHFTYATDNIRSCNVTELGPCHGEHQVCSQITHECICDDGFTRVGEDCVVPGEGYHTQNTTAALVTIFTLALIICGLVLVVRKYNLIEYVRQKINLRRNTDVMYEDVMIGQDDPPLSP